MKAARTGDSHSTCARRRGLDRAGSPQRGSSRARRRRGCRPRARDRFVGCSRDPVEWVEANAPPAWDPRWLSTARPCPRSGAAAPKRCAGRLGGDHRGPAAERRPSMASRRRRRSLYPGQRTASSRRDIHAHLQLRRRRGGRRRPDSPSTPDAEPGRCASSRPPLHVGDDAVDAEDVRVPLVTVSPKR